MQLNVKVADLICNQQWRIPRNFCTTFPNLSKAISEVKLPFNPCDEVLIWSDFLDGHLTFLYCYETVRFKKNLVAWAKFIWSSFIPLRYSSLVWRMLYNILYFKDILQIRRTSLASVCRFFYKGPDGRSCICQLFFSSNYLAMACKQF